MIDAPHGRAFGAPESPAAAETAAPTLPTRTDGSARRTLLHAAAWTVPTVALAVAAPLAAASQRPAPAAAASLVFDTWRNNAAWDGAGHRVGIVSGVQVQNRYYLGAGYSVISAPVNRITVDIVYPASVGAHGDPESVTGSGWTFASRGTGATGSVTYTFVYVGQPLGPSRSTPELNVRVAATPGYGASASAIAFAPNADIVGGPGYGDPIY